MATPAFVQEVTAVTSELIASTTLVVPINQTTSPGNSLVLFLSGRDEIAAPLTVVDSRGNVWSAFVQDGEGTSNTFASIACGYMGSATALQTGDSLTITFGDAAGSAINVQIEEFSGLSSGVSLDAYGAGPVTGDATPTVTALVASSQAVELAVTLWCAEDITRVFTQDANYTNFPTAQMTTSGALPGDRTSIAGYRILSSVATESSTLTMDDSTPVVGVIVTFKAAADTPDSPVATTYGVPWASDSLANLEMGRQPNRRLAIRWRATKGGDITGIHIYHKAGVGYSAGTGGRVRCDVMSDDGTLNHFPSGTVLATSVNTATPNASSIFLHTLSAPLTLVQGQIYHFVFTNTDPTPTANYVSLNSLDIEDSINPIQKAVSNDDMAVVWQDNGAPWVRHPLRTPIFTVVYSDGTHKGQSYFDTLSVSGLTLIQGANNMARMTFTPTQAFSINKVWWRGFKISGETQPLVLTLQNAGGSTIASASILAAAIAVGVAGDPPHGAAWYSAALAPQALVNGTTYRLQQACPAGATGYDTWPIQAGGSGFAANLDTDNRFLDGYMEKTTSGSGGFATIAGSQLNKPQVYFETVQTAPAGGPAPLGRTLRGVGA